jgi:pyruvate,orthophosphate dikinase
VGCGELEIDERAGVMQIGDVTIAEGDFISLDGSTGEVMLGEVSTTDPELGEAFGDLMKWADRFRTLQIRANADNPHDARVARRFGAEGIGLCRTEHMFFEPGRIRAMQRMILATDEQQRTKALDELLPIQRADFEELFETMDGLPVTIRLLDPPLHEFLPRARDASDEQPADTRELQELATSLSISLARLRAKLNALKEHNPMLGHRGCRLGVSHPEIYEMQVRAIAEAAFRKQADGVRVRPEIMIPLVANERELALLRRRAEETIAAVRREFPRARLRLAIGTMIEVPRAALTADVIARHADFFSFGTNDLTQMGMGLSRDDTGPVISYYQEHGLYERDPFASLDFEGIGRMVRIATDEGRAAKPGLKVGVCGEHGGDPRSIGFFHDAGLDYVSCSPFRVPIARLAAAQAALAERG